eukprot:6916177-Alexandrium_andersonii.AAC.1
MVSGPPDTCDGLVYSVVAQASLAQHWVRQDRPRIAILNHQDSKGRVAGVLREEAIIHRSLRHV